jgi:hypothetical protein
VSISKLFFVTGEEAKLARSFAPDKPLCPGLIFVSKARTQLAIERSTYQSSMLWAYQQILNQAGKACLGQLELI